MDTTTNTLAKYILEIIHQTLPKMVHTIKLEEYKNRI